MSDVSRPGPVDELWILILISTETGGRQGPHDVLRCGETPLMHGLFSFITFFLLKLLRPGEPNSTLMHVTRLLKHKYM